MYLLHFYISLLPGTETGLIILVIGAIAFLFWNWLFKRNIKKESTRKIATWSATVISTGLVYAAIIALIVSMMNDTPPAIDFNKEQWHAAKAQRFQMADDIINSRMLIGKDSNAVNAILGIPDGKVYSPQQYTYEMGACPAGFGVTFHSLLLKCDSAGKVIGVEHIRVKD